MFQSSLYICLGYLSGSVLYARIFAGLFHKEQLFLQSKDHNPGAANAFVYGGFWCGFLTLACDVLKGFFPVFLFTLHGASDYPNPILPALVLAAPVIGHIFPLFYRFRGGKGIAVTFGCLLGFYPALHPFIILAFCFIFFSTILKITPHFYRTVFSYISAFIIMYGKADCRAAVLGFLIITAAVLAKLFFSKEEHEKLGVKLFGRSGIILWDRRRT